MCGVTEPSNVIAEARLESILQYAVLIVMLQDQNFSQTRRSF